MASLKIIFLVLALTIPLAVATAGCLNHRDKLLIGLLSTQPMLTQSMPFPNMAISTLTVPLPNQGFPTTQVMETKKMLLLA